MKAKRILVYLIVIVLASCKPDEQPPTVSYVFSDVSVVAGQTSATITCRNESVDDDKVHASVLLSKSENITDATKYPMRLQNDTLRGTINGLEQNTMYYFCFEVYTSNEHKRTDEVHHFETTGGGNITVTTSEAINVTQTTATGGGSVVADGNYTVSMRGVCWDTMPNPNALQNPHLVSGQGTGAFLVNITGLMSHTQYYMKAYAVCNDVVYYGNEVNFVTLQTNNYTIGVSANPSNGGTATGGGSYEQGQSCTVIATAANGYRFINWTENGNEVSTNANYTFTVNDNRTLVANFSEQAPNTYTINASPNPTNGGNVSGDGSYEQGQSCSLTATANTGYTFTNWTENGSVVSTNANYTFTVNANRTLVANFTANPQNYTISVSANPSNGGSVSGGGTYQQGQQSTVTATANEGYTFTNWTEGDNIVSTQANYTFTVNSDRNLVANFTVQAPNTYNINVSSNPSAGGTVTGGGSYSQGASCTITATANDGYTFLRWTENGNQVSNNANYTFTVTGNRTLVAQFQVQSYTITASANPSNGGTAIGGGNFNYGQSCTVSATAATGYSFTNWTENGSVVSTQANYTFTVNNNRTLVANFTAQNYTINVSANPSNGGSVSGGGNYNYGQNCTVSASANTGYTFLQWTENGNPVSTNANYTFTVTGNRTLVAQFQSQSYTISVSASPTNGGNVSGGGAYNYGQSCTVTATANSGFSFTNWTENGNQVSTNSSYTFTVNSNRTLVANFIESQPPTGAINGLFTINSNGDKVYFSQGNLQYIGSAGTPYWKFAENQWEYLGTATGQNSSNINVDRDLFGWGTSGWNSGANCYQPWSTSENHYDYYPGGSYANDLTGSYANADWGQYNAIINGGNQAGLWRTLTISEWRHVLIYRNTTYGIHYAKAQVADVNGLILLPDNWSPSTYSLANPDNSSASFSSNVISATQWTTLENAGAVFLPAAGGRSGTSLMSLGSYGTYWSATAGYGSEVNAVRFKDNNLDIGGYYRYFGYSVRVVQDY